MTRRAAIILAVLMAAATAAPAQDASPPTPPEPPAAPTTDGDAAEATGTAPATIPDADDVFGVINKATGEDGEAADWSAPVKLAVIFALLALLPALLVMMTAFTRIIIVLSFLRRALTTQSIPPTIALIGLALFLTLFTMAPTFGRMNGAAVRPYLADEITFPVAIERANQELKRFMFRQTRGEDLALFAEMGDVKEVSSVEDIPSHVMIPSFAVSEFRKAFEMGCLIFIPFLLVDLVTAGILLSTGMMMLPPAIISLPFKIILFVLVDGWRLIARTLVTSFN